MTTSGSARSEWRRYWALPLAAALGYSSSVLHMYSFGAFILPLQAEFGWSRAQVSIGLTIVGISDVAFAIPFGMLIDRVGPRMIALSGALLVIPAVSLLGTATGTMWNWLLLWAFVAFVHLWMMTTVWTSAVATRFDKSRGMAFAITLSGASLGSSAFPILATWLIGAYGWRTAFPSMACGWMALVLPMLWFFFRGAKDKRREASAAATSTELPGMSIGEGLRSSDFYKLLVATSFFAITAIGIIVHFVPILTDSGAAPLMAASTASLIGLFSIVGRLGTGFLLDRFTAQWVGACAFLLSALGCSLIYADGSDRVNQVIAAVCFGVTLGAEVDVVAYLTSRRFGLKHFGVFNGAMAAALASGVALGPLAAGAAFDHFGGYREFLVLAMCLSVSSCIALLSMRPATINAAVIRA